jgi:N-acetylglucosaminyl-diphospho-decaprenol L-rhamnosyltransferase
MAAIYCISIVSHGDEDSILNMLTSSSFILNNLNIEIIIRENKNVICTRLEKLAKINSNINLVYNDKIRGFGANHNLNFNISRSDSDYFIVCNPDLIDIPNLDSFEQLKSIYYLATPVISNIDGSESDFRRGNITFLSLFKRFLGFSKIDCISGDQILWVPSVFKIFSRSLFEKLDGYDENIFMYYEDYDICRRALKYCDINIIDNMYIRHEGRRKSRKNIFLLLRHLQSVIYVKNKHGY